MSNRFTQWFATTFSVLINDADIESVQQLFGDGDVMSARMVAGQAGLTYGQAEMALNHLERDGILISEIVTPLPSPSSAVDQFAIHPGYRLYQLMPRGTA